MPLLTLATALARAVVIFINITKHISKKRLIRRFSKLHIKPSKLFIPSTQHLLKESFLPTKAINPKQASLNKILSTTLINI